MTTSTHSHKAWTDEGGHVIAMEAKSERKTIQETPLTMPSTRSR